MNEPKSAIVTGATAGLGLSCAERLARRGWHVVLACRDAGRGAAAREKIGAGEVRALDVSRMESVRAFVEELRAGAAARPPLGALVCNAGVQAASGPARTTREGLEETFATNHLGHFLLARLLLPDLAPGACVAFVASNTHDPKKWTGMPAPHLGDVRAVARGEGLEARTRYTTSKLYNVLCAYELHRRTREAPRPPRVVAFDPGLMPGTGLARDYGPAARFLWRYALPLFTAVAPNVNRVATSAERLVAVVEEDEEDRRGSGTYVSRGKAARSSEASYERRRARDLWEASSELVGLP